MRKTKHFALFCTLCLFCQPILAQRRERPADLPLFEHMVLVVKYFEGLHRDRDYVGYGHRLLPNERFTADMTERQADSLLRADLWKCFGWQGCNAFNAPLLQCRRRALARLWQASQESITPKDRSRRQEFLS